MTLLTKYDNMRICYQHWIGKNIQDKDIEKLTIITYAVFLEIIDTAEDKHDKGQIYIENAKDLLYDGLTLGWLFTH